MTFKQLLLLTIAAVIVLMIPYWGLMWPPNTWGDMRRTPEEFEVPSDFELIGEGFSGRRRRFMAPSAPSRSIAYSAPWDSDRLCERIENLVADRDRLPVPETRNCGFSISVDAGWQARLVNVHRYRLHILAVSPEQLPTRPDSECREIRTRQAESARPDLRLMASAPCRVKPGETIVTVTVTGKLGW